MEIEQRPRGFCFWMGGLGSTSSYRDRKTLTSFSNPIALSFDGLDYRGRGDLLPSDWLKQQNNRLDL